MRYDVILLPLAAAAAMSFASPGRSQTIEPTLGCRMVESLGTGPATADIVRQRTGNYGIKEKARRVSPTGL